MQQGVEIVRYKNVQEFILAHHEGIKAIDRLQQAIYRAIESQYKP